MGELCFLFTVQKHAKMVKNCVGRKETHANRKDFSNVIVIIMEKHLEENTLGGKREREDRFKGS